MKIMKIGLRIWFTLISIIGFFVGWVTLAHAGKPASFQSPPAVEAPAPLPTLAPIAPLGNNGPVQFQPASPPTSNFSFFPRFRTRGS